MSSEFQGGTQGRQEAAGGDASVASGPEPRQPIHGFAGGAGLLFLLIGIGGFIPGITSNYDELKFAGPDSGAKLVGLFQVSVLHNLVHLIFALGLIAAARYAWSRLYLLGGGVVLLVVAVYGVLVERESDANFLPINAADNLLHLGLGLAMVALGVLGVRLSRGRPTGA